MSQTLEIEIAYLNARNGNRPPSIKDTQGNYYTISDDAYQSLQTAGWGKGHRGQISFTTNQKGFNNATHWNGAELPRNAAPPSPPRAPSPPPPSAPPAVPPPPALPKVDNKDMTIFVTGVIGRAFHGTGQLPGRDELAAMVRACRQAYEIGMGSADHSIPEPAAPLDDPPPPTSPEDYGQSAGF